MTKIAVCTTAAPFKMSNPLDWMGWLTPLEVPPGVELRYFAALEVDGRGITPYQLMLGEMTARDLDADHWAFRIDDHRAEIGSSNRVHHICAGRNLCIDWAQNVWADWILWLDTDVTPPADIVPRLLELEYPAVGLNVPTYCLDGPPLHWPFEGPGQMERGWDVREHMNTAGCLMIQRDLFRRLRWRFDLDRGLTDDPCFHEDLTRLGYPTRVRHDVTARHYPECIGPLEYRGHDLRIQP